MYIQFACILIRILYYTVKLLNNTIHADTVRYIYNTSSLYGLRQVCTGTGSSTVRWNGDVAVCVDKQTRLRYVPSIHPLYRYDTWCGTCTVLSTGTCIAAVPVLCNTEYGIRVPVCGYFVSYLYSTNCGSIGDLMI